MATKTIKHAGNTATLEAPTNTGWLPTGPAPARPIREIVDEFLTVLGTHPDAKLLSVRDGGVPNRHEAFPGVLTSSQNVVSVRFLIRT